MRIVLAAAWAACALGWCSELGTAFVVPPSSSIAATSRAIGAQQRQRTAAVRMAAGAGEDWALIFDCDGVILESESLHREAYNAVFREFNIDYQWSPEYYDVLQNQVGGGKPKMRYYFGENGWPTSTLGPAPVREEDRDRLIDELQDRKTEIYKEFVCGGTAQLRPGIQRVIDEACTMSGGKLAICSASTKSSCLYVLDNLLGPANLDKFDLILAGDDVPNRKPDPMIYTMASESLGVSPERCVVIEDSLIGLQAATLAGMRCVITTTSSTKDQDFSAADRVFSELGDGPGPKVTARELIDILQ